MRKLKVFLVLLILAGCYKDNTPAKFQIATSPSGVTYRLNITSGEVWSITPAGLIKLQETNLDKPLVIHKTKSGNTYTIKETNNTLTIGNYYMTENGKTLKYIGNGQFEHWQPKTAK